MEESRGLGDEGRTGGEVVDKDGAEVNWGEEGLCEGRLCEVGRERVVEPGVQKPLSDVTATADEEGVLTGAPVSGAAKVEV